MIRKELFANSRVHTNLTHGPPLAVDYGKFRGNIDQFSPIHTISTFSLTPSVLANQQVRRYSQSRRRQVKQETDRGTIMPSSVCLIPYILTC